ncbi:NlpC/P60 family protein [Devosia sp. YIM 151766]|uniref:NlpC/P60 family protein n=1 Tax=Devosia sp. YIM 151766 TaxID=3017325 RepID=UPI00255C626B|nr:NlpC/P60 family protein [Devosia sp. YIM 151766]WIY53676.1 NlpC/P60 family protein [Devosia sp. YIM 151766]
MNGEIVVAAARQWLGTPYRHRASTRGAGCDCLGLLRGVWRTLYGDEPAAIPPYRADWRDPRNDGALQAAAERFLLAEAGEAAAGQVVLFRLAGLEHARHCGIMVSADRFIHAQEHLGVVEGNVTMGWARRVSGRFRFPEVPGLP